MKESEKLKVHALVDIEYLKVHGRTTGNLSPLTLFWTGSAIELNVKGGEFWIDVEARYDVYEPWISVVINGEPVSRQMVAAGRHWVCVFRGMNPQAVKNVRVVREWQAMSGDPGCLLQVHAVRTDGVFLPIEDRPYKIEFIGDSITSGEGAIGARHEADWIPMWFSAVHNYCAMTADTLNAEYRVISQSGWGVFTGWNNDPHANIPELYEKVCGLVAGEQHAGGGALQDNDFDAWQPDVVVVNLGTNDGGAFYSPEWIDPETGEAHKQRLNEDGTLHEEDVHAFELAVENFLVKLRKYNQNAHIIWAYGMLGIPMMPAIYRAVDAYSRKTHDMKVSVFQLPNTTVETRGARSHPGYSAHRNAANELSGYIRQFLIQ